MAEIMGGDIGALAKALAAAQGEMKNAAKDGTNPHFNSSFATLASVRDVVHGPLSKNGLALTQHPSADGNVVTVRTLLLHEVGGWLSTEITANAKDAGPQAIGSAISYLRRYSLAALCGVAQEDDDGEAAGKAAPAQRAKPKAERGASPPSEDSRPISTPQREFLEKLLKSHVVTEQERAKMLKAMTAMTRDRATAAIEKLKGEIEARKAAERVDTETGEVLGGESDGDSYDLDGLFPADIHEEP